jgi:hypothetical protein
MDGVSTLEHAVVSSTMFVAALSSTEQRQLETEKEISHQGVKRQGNWTYLSLEKINSISPSRKDGIDEIKEARWRREYLHLIQKAGMALKV